MTATGALDFAEAVRREATRPRQPTRPWVLDRDWSVVADKILHDLLAAPAVVPHASPAVMTDVTAR
jgi:hypothetical protein